MADNKKKIIGMLVAIVVIALVAIGAATYFKKPEINSPNDAANHIYGETTIIEDYIAYNDEVPMDTTYVVEPLEAEIIDGKEYYPVHIYDEDTNLFDYYFMVRSKDAKVFLKGADGTLAPVED